MNNINPVILLIDDEIQIINSFKRIFHGMNYEIIATAIPEEAFDIIKDRKVDIIICDYKMPSTNGIDVLKYAKRIQPDAYRILMTGHCDINIAISAINEGSVYYYISKPWKNEEVISIVNTVIEKNKNLNQQKELFSIINESQNYLAEVSNKLKSMDNKGVYKNIKVPVLEDDNILIINSNDILYLTANEGDVLIISDGGKYKSNDALNIWNAKLDERMFFRCHRSYIVNLEKIEKISPWFNGTYNIKLRNCKDNIPVSRGNMKRLRDILGI